MGHDLHFLERLDRLDEQQITFAFSLYRNAKLVKELVTRVATEGVGRVAIALTEEPEPPHVLVARNGHFVTCLAAGMRHELPVISRAAVDKARREHESLRLAFEATAALRHDGGYGELVKRLCQGPRVTQEDMRDVMSWAPAVSARFSATITQSFRQQRVTWTAVSTPEVLKPRHEADVQQLWKETWQLGHFIGPSMTGLRVPYGRPSASGSRFRGVHASLGMLTYVAPSVLRGLWGTTSLGDLGIDDLEAGFLTSDDSAEVWSGALALAATGLRWPTLRARAAAALAQTPAFDDSPEGDNALFLDRLREVLARPEEALERHLARATEALRAKIGDVSELEVKTLLAASFYDERALDGIGQYLEIIDAIPFVAASEFADLYLPKAVLDRFPPAEDLAVSAHRFVKARRDGIRKENEERPPAPPAPTAGRNEPCPCGSGKKFKKCCAA